MGDSEKNSEELIDIIHEGEIDAVFCLSCRRIYLDNGDGSYVGYCIEE